jgi:hypothetical protein
MTRRWILLLVTVLAGFLALPAGPAKASPQPPAVRVTHYDITAEIAPEKKFLTATATLTLEGAAGGPLRLFLHKEFSVEKVSSRGMALPFRIPEGAPTELTYSPSARAVDIDWPLKGRPAKTGEVEIVYSGPVSETINDVNLISGHLVEIASYCAWYPLVKDSRNFTYSLAVTLPAGFRSATDGDLVSETASGSKITRRYRRELTGLDIPFFASDDIKVKARESRSLNAAIYYRKLDDRLAEESLDLAVRAADLLSEKLGPPSAKGKLIVVCSPRSGWGYSRVPMIIGPEEYIMSQLAQPSGKIENFHGLVHEIGHFWWMIADTSTSADWINESLAEFSSLWAMEAIFGRAEVDRIMRRYGGDIFYYQTEGKAIAGTKRSDPSAYVLFYEKGAYVFQMLRDVLGEGRLFSVLKNYYLEHRRRADASTATLLSAFEREADVGGVRLAREYVMTGNLPILKLDWHIKEGAVEGTATLENSTLESFPVELRFERQSEGLRESRTLSLQAGANPFLIPLSFEPDAVRLDPDHRMLWGDPSEIIGFSHVRKLLPLVHGPNMDFYPDIIPEENIEKASGILEEWGRQDPNSPDLLFERGWYHFLKGDYQKAIACFKEFIPYIDSRPIRSWFYGNETYRNLGLCYDLIGERTEALDAYAVGVGLAQQAALGDRVLKALFGNYREVPFRRRNNIHVAAYSGDLEKIDILLEKDPGLAEAKDDLQGQTPLFWAVKGDSLKAAELLINRGADVNARDPSGRTPLAVAHEKKFEEMTELLKTHGARQE